MYVVTSLFAIKQNTRCSVEGIDLVIIMTALNVSSFCFNNYSTEKKMEVIIWNESN